MARSQALVTWRRLLVATLQALGAAYYVAGAHAALVAAAVALVISAASIYYAKAILGGVVGDYIGARPWRARARVGQRARLQGGTL